MRSLIKVIIALKIAINPSLPSNSNSIEGSISIKNYQEDNNGGTT
jgi:hypothetical protein